MRILQVTSRLSAEIKKLYIYYFIYSLLFIFLHLVMVSTFSFFHFLLNHDMSTIENWLNRNTWEILSMSKLASLIFTGQIVKLNHYSDIKFQDFFSDQSLWPSKKIFGMSLFILTIFYALIIQFGGGVVQNQFKEELFYSSFLGSFLFYMADFVMVYFLVLVFEIPRRHLLRLIYPCLFLFLVTSKVALPYLNKFHVFLVVHYFTLFLIAAKGKLVDTFAYSFLVIAPLSTIYGLDIVWDNSYSLFSYQESLPLIGILGVWGLAIGYYHYSHAD